MAEQATGDNAATTDKKPEVIIPEGMHAEVFHFRKEDIKDPETGKSIGETFKHPSVTLAIPTPTREQLLEILNAPSEGDGNRASEQKYVIDLVKDALYIQAREQINDAREEASKQNNREFRVTSDVLDYSKLSITALANMPASERGNKLSDEAVKDFLADYVAIMPAALNKDANKIKAQADIFEKGMRNVRTDKKVLAVLQNCLTVWAANTQNMEENVQVYDAFTNRIVKWLSSEPKNVMDSII